MRYGPPVAYVQNATGTTIAYQVLGDGPVDLVFLLGWPTHVALMWEHPAFAGFLQRLASFSRLILFDRPGSGMSDRGPTGQPFEEWMEDTRTVLDAVGSERTAFFGCHLGGRIALLFAATHPDRTTAVVTFAAHPATLQYDDYPWGSTPEEREALLDRLRAGDLDPLDLLLNIAPQQVEDAPTRRWWATHWNSAASPRENDDEITAMGPVDIRGLLGAIRVPVLLLHRSGDRVVQVHASRYMAERLPDATFRELPGDDHLPFFGDQETVLDLAEAFLTGTTPTTEPDRVVVTVMFTDIVDSTSTATRLGDRRWEHLLAEHDEVVRGALARSAGGR